MLILGFGVDGVVAMANEMLSMKYNADVFEFLWW